MAMAMSANGRVEDKRLQKGSNDRAKAARGVIGALI